MGIYINPGSRGFAQINDSDYVDKTLLIDRINQTIGKKNSLTCISRPRRFGKTYAAKMLSAYYDCTCDSHPLFDDKKIAQTKDYETHLNRYNVIYLDITSFISLARRDGIPYVDIPKQIVGAVLEELISLDGTLSAEQGLENSLICYVENTERPFIFILDEWDALIREAKEDADAQKRFLYLLRGWFKNANFTPKVVAAAYMTGILPIKKDGSQSAISDFDEHTMLDPWPYGAFVGFTEREVRTICEESSVSFETMKRWYDGYDFDEVGAVYNPNSVMKAARRGRIASYWTETSAAEGLLDYISRDYNGLTKTVAELIGGVEVKVNTTGFANDLTTFRGRDDVLTLMVHLGYLAYDSEHKTVRIPNEESEQLFADTIQGDEQAVAAQIEKVHAEETVALH